MTKKSGLLSKCPAFVRTFQIPMLTLATRIFYCLLCSRSMTTRDLIYGYKANLIISQYLLACPCYSNNILGLIRIFGVYYIWYYDDRRRKKWPLEKCSPSMFHYKNSHHVTHITHIMLFIYLPTLCQLSSTN